MPQAGAVWVDVIPSMKGFGKSVEKQTTTALGPVGAKAGAQYGKGLTTSATAGAAAAGTAVTTRMRSALAPAEGLFTRFGTTARSAFGRVGLAASSAVSAVTGSTRTMAQGLTDFGAGFQNAQAAASAFTGRMGTMGGAVRRALDPGIVAGQNLVAGFTNASAAASAFTGRAGTLGGVLRRGVSAVGGGVSRMATTVRGAAIRFRDSIRKDVSFPLSGVARQVAGLAALAGFGALGVSAVKAAAGIEKTNKTLTGLYGSADTATDMMGRLRRVAASSPIAFQSYAKGAEQLAYMGYQGKDAEQVLRNVGAAVTAAGGGSEKLDQATAGMLQMVNAGKVGIESLNRISEAGVPIYSALAAHFDTNIAGVREMVQTGKVGIDDVMGSIQRAEGKTFKQMQAAAEQASKTLSAQWAMLKDNIVTGLGAALRPAVSAAAPIVGQLGQRIGAGFQALPALFSRIGAVMRETGITAALAAIGRAAMSLAKGAWPILQGAVAGFGAAFGGLAVVMRPVAALLTRLGGWMQQHAGVMRVIGAAVGILAAGFVAVRIATTAWAVAQWALNAAMSANPIGAIVALIAALIVGVIYAYKNFTWFRTAVNAVWGALKVGALAVWNALKVVFSAIGVALRAVGAVFVWLYRNVVQPVWTGIKVIIGVYWMIIKAYFYAIRFVITKILAPVFLWLYRNIVKPVWSLIKIAIQVAWVFIQIIFKSMQIAVRAVGMVFRWLWVNVIRPVWAGIKRIIAVQWAAIRIVFTAIVRFVRAVLGAVFRWLWRNIISPVWNGIRRVIAAQWLAIRIIFAAIRRYIIGPLAGVFRWIWHNVISPVWNGIRRTISTVWTGGIRPVFSALSRFVRTTIPNAFRTGVSAVKKAWNAVKAAAKAPVSFVLRTVIKDGIVGGFNKIAGVFGVKPIKFAIPKGFAQGTANLTRAADVGWTNKPTAIVGEGSRRWAESVIPTDPKYRRRAIGLWHETGAQLGMPMMASGGRLVAFGKWLQRQGFRVGEHPAFGGVAPVHTSGSWHYRRGAIDVNYGPGGSSAAETKAFNRLIKSGIARKQYGLRSIWDYPGHHDHAHFDLGSGPDLGMRQGGGKGVLGFLGGLFGKLTNPFKGLLAKVKKKMGTYAQWGGVLTASMKKLISGAWEWVKAHNPFAGVGETNTDAGGARRWAPLVRQVLKELGEPASAMNAVLHRINQESGGNPRAVNNWDINAKRGTPSKGLMQTIGPTFNAYAGKYRGRGIFDPLANIYAGINYARNRYGRGWIRKMTAPGGYDDGGWLMPGATMAFNATRKPEAVLTDKQWQAIRNNGNRAALIDTVHLNQYGGDSRDTLDALQFRLRHIRRGGVYAGT